MRKLQMSGKNFILLLIQGMIIGVGGILPGVSGGVLCMAFGLYKPVMEVLASPRKNLKTHLGLLIPVGIGGALGCFGLAHFVGAAMNAQPELSTTVFAGLILGTLPALLRTAREKAPSRGSLPALFVSFIFFFTLFCFLNRGDGLSLTPNFFWYLLAGAIWGISIVLPGLSSSGILLFLGLFEPMVRGAKSFDLGVLIPLAVGGVGAIVLLARLVNRLFDRYPAVMSYIVLGIVAATTIPILPMRFASVADFAVKAALLVIGFAVAVAFDLLGRKFECN